MKNRLLVFQMVALFLLTASSAFVSPVVGTYPNNGEEWDISGTQTLTGETKVINSLNVQGTGSLVLENCNVTVLGTSSVASGGRLIVRNSTISLSRNLSSRGQFLFEGTTVLVNNTVDDEPLLEFFTSASDFVTFNQCILRSNVSSKGYNIRVIEDNTRPSTLSLTNTEFHNLGEGDESGFGLLLWNCSGTVIDNITIKDLGHPVGNGCNAMMFQNCDNCMVQDSTLNTTDDNVNLVHITGSEEFTESFNNTFERCELSGGLFGILLNGPYAIAVIDTRIVDCEIRHAQIGIYSTGATINTLVEGCDIHNNTFYGYWNLAKYWSVPPYPRFYIYNSTIHDNVGTGIMSYYKTDIIIRHNDIYNNGYQGIMVDMTDNQHSGFMIAYGNTTIEDNRIINNNIGVFLFGKNAFIRRNVISHSGQDGIYARGPVTSDGTYIFPINPEIRDNLITNNVRNGIWCNVAFTEQYKTAKTPKDTIELGDNPKYSIDMVENITNNVITNNGQDGVNIQASPAMLVGNTITGNTRSQVAVNESAMPTLVDNTVGTPKYHFVDSLSTIKESWQLNITVEDGSAAAVDGASVNITDSGGNLVQTDTTPASGRVGTYLLPQKTITQSATTNDSPYNITVSKTLYHDGYLTVTLDQHKDVTVVLPLNQIPPAASAIQPSTTHDLTPQLTWTAPVDPDGDFLTYNVNIGTTAGGSDIVNNVTGTTGVESFDVPAGALNFGSGENTYFITVWADDGWLGYSRATGTLTVTNTRPTQPTLSITPALPDDDDDLVCSITGGGSDTDTDPTDNLTYMFEWKKNDAVQAVLGQNGTAQTSTVSADYTDQGDIWTCRARVFDGYMWGTWSEEVSVQMEDKPPTANLTHWTFTSGVTLMEDDETWLDMEEMFSDPDGPFSGIQFTFDLIGDGDGHVTMTKSPGSSDLKIAPDDDWHGSETYTITAASGAQSATANMTITVYSVNDPPSIETVGGKPLMDGKVILRGKDAATEGEDYELEIVVEDPDVMLGEKDTLTFMSSDERITVLTTRSGGNVSLSFTPTTADVKAGEVIFDLTVTSSNTENGTAEVETANVSITIDIKNNPDPPVLLTINGEDVSDGIDLAFKGENGAFEDMVFYLNVTADDPDFQVTSEKLTFSLDGPADVKNRFIKLTSEEDTRNNSWQFQPDQNDVGEVDLTVTVTDSKGNTESVNVTLEITNVNDAPEAPEGDPFTFTQTSGSMEVGFSAGAFSDPDPGSDLTYTWDFDDGNDKSGDDKQNVTHTYEEAGEYNVTLTVSDGEAEIETFMLVTVTENGGEGEAEAEAEAESESEDPWKDTTDSDGDGVYDWWEEEHGLDPTDPYDIDADKMADFEEEREKAEGSEGDGDEFPWWIIILIIVIIVIVVLLLVMMRKKKDEEPEGPPMEEGMPMEGMGPEGPMEGGPMYQEPPPEGDMPTEGGPVADDMYAEDVPMGEDVSMDDEVPMAEDLPEGEEDPFGTIEEGASDEDTTADSGEDADSDELFGEI